MNSNAVVLGGRKTLGEVPVRGNSSTVVIQYLLERAIALHGVACMSP